MTSLRQRFIEDMQVRNFSPVTQASYTREVSGFARYFNKSPELLGPEQIRAYQVYLRNEKKLGVVSISVATSALRFLYRVTLKKNWCMADMIPAPKVPKKLPIILSPEEVVRFLDCVAMRKHRAVLTTCLPPHGFSRISEAVALTLPAIDSQRMVLRVEQGKGQKDRLWAMAHKRSYVPGKVMRRVLRQNLRRQTPGNDCPAHNYLPLNEAISLSVGRKEPLFRVGGRTTSSISRFSEGSARRYTSVLCMLSCPSQRATLRISPVARRVFKAQVCRQTCGDTRLFSKEEQMCAAARRRLRGPHTVTFCEEVILGEIIHVPTRWFGAESVQGVVSFEIAFQHGSLGEKSKASSLPQGLS